MVRLTIYSGGGKASIKAIKAEGSVNRAWGEVFGGDVPEGIRAGAYQVVGVVRGDYRQNAWTRRRLVGNARRARCMIYSWRNIHWGGPPVLRRRHLEWLHSGK